MGRINESWGPGVDGLRDDNPLNGALMNLDDVRKTLDEGVSSKSYELFDSLWESLLNDARIWEKENPETIKSKETKGDVDAPEGIVKLSSGEVKVPDGVVELPAGEVTTSTTPKKPRMVPIPTFITMLRSDVVLFQYEKTDGSLRIAYGTRNPKIISTITGVTVAGVDYTKSDKKKKIPEDSVVYFDMEKEQFRSFKEYKFLGVIDEHAVYTPTVSENRFLMFEEFTSINEALDYCYGDDCEEEEEE